MSTSSTASDLRFGLLTSAADRAGLHEDARRAEGDGFDLLALTDHLDLSGAHVARLAWLPALASAAAVTSTLRFTTMIANQDLREPAVLACDVASLDRVSDGRYELGLGAGWNEAEYRWAGIAYAPAGQRISRLAEVAQAVRGITSDAPGPFTLRGEYVTIDAMPRVPSVQQPIPLRMGGAQPRMLALAARMADIVNLLTLRDSGPTDEVLPAKIAMLGDSPAVRELSVVLVATGADDPVEAVRRALPTNPFAQRVAADLGVEAVARLPHVLAGSPGAIAEELLRRREKYGIVSTIMPAGSAPDVAPVLARLR